MATSQLRDFQTLDASGKFKIVPEYPNLHGLRGCKCITHEITHKANILRYYDDDSLKLVVPEILI